MAHQRAGLGFDILAAVLRDGYAAAFGQQVWGLFDPRRTLEASAWQFERFAAVAVVDRARYLLDEYAAELSDTAPMSEVTLTLLPIDPANPFDLVADHGLSCYAAAPGVILLALWPSDGNIARLGPALARALVQNLAYSGAPPPRTLADVLLLEGHAAAFAGRHLPDDPTPWLAPFRAPPDHQDTLAHAARLLGLGDYAALRANVFGAEVTRADVVAPTAAPLDDNERGYAWQVIEPMLEVTDARTIAAHLYGDELVAAQGHPSAGLAAYAGFEIGYGMAQRA
jgi:uncharacterized protein YjaZ